MIRLNKLLFLLIVSAHLILINTFAFAESSGQNRSLDDLKKFDPDSSNVNEKAEIVPPIIRDKNTVIPEDGSDNGILKTPPDTDANNPSGENLRNLEKGLNKERESSR